MKAFLFFFFNVTIKNVTVLPEQLLLNLLIQVCTTRQAVIELIQTDSLASLFVIPLSSDASRNLSLRDRYESLIVVMPHMLRTNARCYDFIRILPVLYTIVKHHIDVQVVNYLAQKGAMKRTLEALKSHFTSLHPSEIVEFCSLVFQLLEV